MEYLFTTYENTVMATDDIDTVMATLFENSTVKPTTIDNESIELATVDDNESTVTQRLTSAIVKKYPLIAGTDFDFIKVIFYFFFLLRIELGWIKHICWNFRY